MKQSARLGACMAVLSLASCAGKKAPEPIVTKTEIKSTNPYEKGTYEHFMAEKSYPKTSNTWTNMQLIDQTGPENAWLRVDLAKQRGLLMKGEEVVLDYPISSGKRAFPTPPGEYKVLEKIIDKSSNKYGRMYDVDGKLVNADANAFEEVIPEGGKFVGAPMKYWMRMTWDGVGHHVGVVPRYPASHSCIRGPSRIMPIIYSKLAVGSRISVK